MAAARLSTALSPALALALAFAASLWPATAGTEGLPDVADPFFYLRAPDRSQPVDDPALQGDSPLAPAVHPANGAVVNQNPPVFRWAADPGAVAWQIRLAAPDGTATERMAAENWLFLDRPLAPGRYVWQARAWPRNGAAGAYGPAHAFTVPLNAPEFVMPPTLQPFQRAAKSPHPRSFPAGTERERLLAALTDGARKAEYQEFLRRLERNFLDGELPAEPPRATWEVADFCESAKVAQAIGRTIYGEAAVLRFAAHAWQATGEARFRDEAVRRMRNLLGWNPDGSTGQRSHGHGSREIAFSLAHALDLTWDAWEEAERRRVVEHILARGQALYDNHLMGTARRPALNEMPYNSHGFRHAGGLLAIAALLAGESERVQQWWTALFPMYVAFNNPWGGDDGGFGNGLGYASWNTEDFLRHWDVLKRAAGVDMTQMSWSQQVGLYLNYFATPQTPDGIFGDGAGMDLRRTFETLAQMYAQRVPKPLYARYAARWGDRGWRDTTVLFGPLAPDGGGKLADPGPLAGMPNGAVFPSIGWAALHSDLEDPERNSLYFLASPYGSFNHSYAAQNAFVAHARGRPLAITSGYYDYYKSPHHAGWTKQTLAQNAITFDGGQGQQTESKAAAGRIVAFRHETGWDAVTGDATAAYAGKLEKARRTIAFLRPDTAVVYDSLASRTPRRWEWNLHAHRRMDEPDSRSLRIAFEDASLCVDLVAGPPTELTQTDAFTAEPLACLGDWPKQWHATFATRRPSAAAGLLAVLRFGCHERRASAVEPKDGGGYRLTIGGREIAIDDEGAEVR